MNADRFADVERVCLAALDLPAAARAAFLDEACAGDAALRAEVEALLGVASETGFLEGPIAAAAPGLSVGQRLGPYEVTGAIGAGGMGEVYKARDTRLGRMVAIKVLPPGFGADRERRARFEREARVIAALSHPHICVLHDVGEHQGSMFLVMEHLDGQSLAERLEKGRLPLDSVLAIGIEVAEALAAAHRQGVVHRDLKPANVMLTKSGAKLLDFGLARPTQPAAGPGRTTALSGSGVMVGTPAYMAPEQVQGRGVDSRTDLFAFGILLYEMLTGKRPFDRPSAAGTMADILERDPEPLAVALPATPPALDRLVRKCLAKAPDDRWQHAADAAEVLREISSTPAAPAQMIAAPMRRRWFVAAGLAAAAVLVAVWLGWRAFRPSPSPEPVAITMPDGTALDEISGGQHIAVAPDGSGVAYVGGDGDRTQVYWHDVPGQGGWPLAGVANYPFFSPDGRWLGFFRNSAIMKVAIAGGRVDENTPAVKIATVDRVRGATWGADGTIVYGTAYGGLWSVNASGGEPRQLTAPDASRNEADHRWPFLLPDGKHVLFTVLDPSLRSERSAVAVLSLEDGTTKTLLTGANARYLRSGHLVLVRGRTLLAAPFDLKALEVTGDAVPVLDDVWTMDVAANNNVAFDVAPDGTLVYATQSWEPPLRTLIWVGRDGNPEVASADRQAYRSLAIAPSDGRRVAAEILDARGYNVWTLDLDGGRRRQLNTEGDSDWPVWSPRGTQVAVRSNRDGPWNVYIMAADGESEPVRVAPSEQMQIPTSWTNDGRYLAYQQQDLAKYNTYVVELGSGKPPGRWGPGNANVSNASFSPDGRWVAYQSGESGPWEVWVRPFAASGPRQLVSGKDGGITPLWSADGREIFYVQGLNDARIMSRQVESLSPLRLGATRVAFALPFALYEGSPLSRLYDVARDGQHVLVAQPAERKVAPITTLYAIRNWPAAVAARLKERRHEASTRGAR